VPKPHSYQLHIQVRRPVTINIGRLGHLMFPAGQYIYTGSAKRNREARLKRHLAKQKLYWHIDYLLAHPDVRILRVRRSREEECRLHQTTNGTIFAPGFGTGDCRHGCGSHLKYIGLLRLASTPRCVNGGHR
jgi:Uri superfamily endonuclease